MKKFMKHVTVSLVKTAAIVGATKLAEMFLEKDKSEPRVAHRPVEE